MGATMSCLELEHVRNMLMRSRFTEDENKMLLYVKNKVVDDNNKFAPLVLFAIENCYKDLQADMERASIEINFIHNLPITKNIDKWNEVYFYNIELSSYIERIEDVARTKKVIAILAEINRKDDVRTAMSQ